jgi:VWFA-related protein
MNVKTIIRWPALVAVVLAALLMGMGLPPAHANQPPGSVASSPEKSEAPISIEAPLVNVDVLVTDQDGRVLSGLKRENFRVLDNGKAQVITHFEPTSAPITIAMLMEYSGTAYNHFAYKAALWGSSFLNHLEPLDWVALVTYDIKPTVRLDFTRNKAEMEQTLSSLSYPQFREANMYDAIIDTLDRLDRVKGKKAMLLISTGANTMSSSTLDETLKRVKQADITIFSVGLAESEYQWADARSSGGRSLGYLQAKNELQTLARLSGGNSWFPRFEGEIPDIFKSVTAFLRSRYSIAFSPQNLASDGRYHKLKIEIVQPDGTPLTVITPKGKRQKPVVYAREGYTAPSRQIQDAD